MKKVQIAVLVVLFSCAFTVFGHTAPATKYDQYKIGINQALSGPFSLSGQAYLFSMERAINEINQAGGIDGVPMKLIAEDHKGKNEQALSNLVKMATIDKVPVSIMGFTGPMMVCAKPAEEYGMLLFNHAAGMTGLEKSIGKNSFHIMANGAWDLYVGLYYAIKELKLKRIGVAWSNYEEGLLSRNMIKAIVPKLGGSVVGDESFPLGNQDFSAYIPKAKTWKADAIYYIGALEWIYFKDAYDFKLKVQQMGKAVTMAFPELITIYGKACEGNLWIGAETYGPWLTEKGRAYREAFKEKFKFYPAFIDQNLYDFPYLMRDLILHAKKAGGDYYTADRLRAALLELCGNRDYKLATGTSFKLDPKTGFAVYPFVIYRTTYNPETKEYYYNVVKSYTMEETMAIRKAGE